MVGGTGMANWIVSGLLARSLTSLFTSLMASRSVITPAVAPERSSAALFTVMARLEGTQRDSSASTWGQKPLLGRRGLETRDLPRNHCGQKGFTLPPPQLSAQK